MCGLIDSYFGLALIPVAFVATIYISARYALGKWDETEIPDCVLVLSCMISAVFVAGADIIDTALLVIYPPITFCIRVFIVKRPFRAPEVALHLVFLYLSLSRLDKLEGYGHPNQFLVLGQYLLLAAIVVSSIYLILRRASVLAIGALLVLTFPIFHFPFELARNLVAREKGAGVAHVYVTKLYAREAYGVPFERRYPVVERFALMDGQYQLIDTNLPNDGGGTMQAQFFYVSSWERAIVKSIFDNRSTEDQGDARNQPA